MIQILISIQRESGPEDESGVKMLVKGHLSHKVYPECTFYIFSLVNCQKSNQTSFCFSAAVYLKRDADPQTLTWIKVDLFAA